jgi:hypothetical protein
MQTLIYKERAKVKAKIATLTPEEKERFYISVTEQMVAATPYLDR